MHSRTRQSVSPGHRSASSAGLLSRPDQLVRPAAQRLLVAWTALTTRSWSPGQLVWHSVRTLGPTLSCGPATVPRVWVPAQSTVGTMAGPQLR